ncbi:G-protein coupled receptor Mth2-like [Trichoplusia ni]|nr:G-protein coupled receptor Mth2-like [Trichoplusia ni]XP_026734363.1 G-protein coupled receptor Mth2-like [Trichoplusia ni]
MGLMKWIVVLPIHLVHVFAANPCCPEGQALLVKRDGCWNPKTNVTSPATLTCKVAIKFVKNFYINEAQQLKLSLGGETDETIEPDAYCAGNLTTIRDVTLNKTKPAVIVCADENEEIIDDRIMGYTMIVSVVFLAATAVIYGFLPELRDVQGKSIINFCTSLAIGLGILVIMKLMEYSDMDLCAARGFLGYFFTIAAFFWSNAISIQVLLNTRRPATLDYSWHEFKWYALYAWGAPAVLTICMAIVNFHPGSHAKPGIGLNHCWFFNKKQQWYYMYSVLSILLAANICIFIYTSLLIWRLSFSSSHIKAVKYKFVMTVRLIVLMGLPWVFEMIGSLAGEHIIW